MKVFVATLFLLAGQVANAGWDYVYSCGDNGWEYKLEKVQKSYVRNIHAFKGVDHKIRRINCYKVANGLNKALVKIPEGETHPILKCQIVKYAQAKLVELQIAEGHAEGDKAERVAYISGYANADERLAECKALASHLGRL